MPKDKETVVTIAVMLPPSMVEYLDQLMEDQDRNRSQVVREIIREYQMVHKKKRAK